MALPAGALSPSIGMVELSIDGTTWVDHSDQITSIEAPAGTRVTGELPVLGEDTMITTVGKREPLEITFRGPYIDTTTTTNAFVVLNTQWTTAGGGEMNIRWAPSGTATDALAWSTATATAGYSELVGLTRPGQDGTAAEPLVYEAVIRCPALYYAAKS